MNAYQPRIVREHKFAAENGPRPLMRPAAPELRPQHHDLLHILDTFPDGVLPVLVIKHGIPFSAEVPGLT